MIQTIHGFLLKCTSGLTAHRLETFILLCSSLLLGRSETVPYSVVELLVAALLSEWEWVITELFRSSQETAQHNSTDQIETQVTSPDWQRRNMYGTNIHFWSHVLQLQLSLKRTYWPCQFQKQFNYCAIFFWKFGFELIGTQISYKHSTSQTK